MTITTLESVGSSSAENDIELVRVDLRIPDVVKYFRILLLIRRENTDVTIRHYKVIL